MSLAVSSVLQPTAPDVIEDLTKYQTVMREGPQVPIVTEHLLHAGMYARTITLPPWTRLIGCHVKRPTTVITVGNGYVSVGRKMQLVRGYRVLPGSAGRKQAFLTKESPLIITAIFPTEAKTVEEAEREFTDEYELLLSHEQDLNTVLITGE